MSNENPLLNNASVQGAAKSIEGLMDSKGVIKKPQEEAAPVEPKEEVEAKAETKTEEQQQPEIVEKEQPNEEEIKPITEEVEEAKTNKGKNTRINWMPQV